MFVYTNFCIFSCFSFILFPGRFCRSKYQSWTFVLILRKSLPIKCDGKIQVNSPDKVSPVFGSLSCQEIPRILLFSVASSHHQAKVDISIDGVFRLIKNAQMFACCDSSLLMFTVRIVGGCNEFILYYKHFSEHDMCY